MSGPRIIAFNLPQFHEIEENNRWWGPGFTDWTNVRKARPLFTGHRQPRVPEQGSYYDLSQRETREWQAQLARSKGIGGFCYYHYWFKGKQLLEKPVDALIAEGSPDFPFCLAWANEPWTRAWESAEKEVLMPQLYGDPADWDAHFAYLLRAFRDRRYIRVAGKPMFLIYRTASIDALGAMLARWRALATEAGLTGLHIVSMQTIYPTDGRQDLVDANVEFEPMYTLAHKLPRWYQRKEKLVRHLAKAHRLLKPDARPHKLNTHDYASLWSFIARRPLPARTYPGAFADWDNTPRRGLRGLVLRNFDRSAFRRGLESQLRKARENGAPFLFFNAWNEWAEGTYLEPDTANRMFFLDTIEQLVAQPFQDEPSADQAHDLPRRNTA